MNQSKLVTEVTLADLRRLGNQGNATARLDNGDEIKLTSRYGLVPKKGYLAGFFDNYKTFEVWIIKNIENYPYNEDIFPLPAQYS